MFRVADIQERQVVNPELRAYLFTWGQGHTTTEGERIPASVQVGGLQGVLCMAGAGRALEACVVSGHTAGRGTGGSSTCCPHHCLLCTRTTHSSLVVWACRACHGLERVWMPVDVVGLLFCHFLAVWEGSAVPAAAPGHGPELACSLYALLP